MEPLTANARGARDAAVLLTVEEMGRADAAAIAGGVSGATLMEAAGAGVAAAVMSLGARRPVTVLCGPGNNGGDGFVAARHLAGAGWPVRLGLLGEISGLKGDATVMAGRWEGAVEPLSESLLDGAEIVVDALFGAGLARPLDGIARAVVEKINARALACIAVDMPSGVHGDSGLVLGAAPRCVATVTFFRRKPGHLLYPGRGLCGTVETVDIGIPETVLADIAPACWENDPALWRAAYPWPEPGDHKYTRGHAVVRGGAAMTGAARLAAMGARRIGAGMVTVACPPEAWAVYAGDRPGTLCAPAADGADFAELLTDSRKNAILVGPGNGVTAATRDATLAALATGRPCVLDADALTAFEGAGAALFAAIAGPCVMTPHDGEFDRLFADAVPGAGAGRPARVRAAAALSGATVLLKGADTVVADPDGRMSINANAPPELATAGAGDVLAGMCLGLLAQGMAPFEAAGAAAWLHGAAAAEFGPGLIAEDLDGALPAVLRRLRAVGEGEVA
ncbi:MAG: NAD(P)H-hydrate dehydratase [Alphaproteobacteria bacterium]